MLRVQVLILSSVNDPLRAVARSTCNHRLEFSLNFADITDGMTNIDNKRIQQLTRNTGYALSRL